MKILQISTYDIGGGAEHIAGVLHHAYRKRGHVSYLAVGSQRGDSLHDGVFLIPGPGAPGAWKRFWTSLQARLLERRQMAASRMALRIANLGEPRTWLERQLGFENFNFPGSRRLLAAAPEPPDILHAHNLHGGYFDLRCLPSLAQSHPLVLTLHDAWLLSGHCTHSLDCERWRHGCGRCPDLTIPVPVRRDATAYNWRRKSAIFARSHLMVATPSRWLMERVEASMLAPAVVEARVINNGVDLDLFRPGDRLAARRALQLPDHAVIALFVAVAARQHPAKDYATLEKAIRQAAGDFGAQPTQFVCLGDQGETIRVGEGVGISFRGFIRDRAELVRYYQAADFYIHSAKADTFPTTILEAMACGLPVVASAVGGIPEQVDDGVTGFLVAPGDVRSLAAGITRLVRDPNLRSELGQAALLTARSRFDQHRMVIDYLDWYDAILSDAGTSAQGRTAGAGRSPGGRRA